MALILINEEKVTLQVFWIWYTMFNFHEEVNLL